MTNQALATQLATESDKQTEGSPIKVSSKAEQPLMNAVREFASKYPKVKKWIQENFRDNGTRSVYGWYLKAVCADLKIGPDKLLKLTDNGESNLFLTIKQHLTALSNQGKSRRAYQMKAAIASFVNYHNKKSTEFRLNVKIKVKAKYERPYWLLDDWREIEKKLNYHYQPLLTIGVMCGLGRRELAYLNRHLNEVKPVPHVPEACYLNMPARKSNSDFYKAILPADEIKVLGGEPVLTTTRQLVEESNLTSQFKAALQRAHKKTTGTGIHVLRAIFKSVGGNANIEEKILDQQMGHFDSEHYDRTDQDLQKRAKALIPLWEYFRRGGPAVATSDEAASLRKELDEVRSQVARLTKQDRENELLMRHGGLSVEDRVRQLLTLHGAKDEAYLQLKEDMLDDRRGPEIVEYYRGFFAEQEALHEQKLSSKEAERSKKT